MRKIHFILFLILSLVYTGLQAQEAIPATDGEVSGIGGSVSYSIGQVFYSTNTSTNNYSIAEGVQQPYEISVVTGIEQAKGIKLKCVAYPNPTSDFLVLKIDSNNSSPLKALSYQLFDINGKMSYQAVMRDASGNLVTNTLVGMQISILQGSATGTAVYTETQTPTTNANGLVTIEIGAGITTDDFSAIN